YARAAARPYAERVFGQRLNAWRHAKSRECKTASEQETAEFAASEAYRAGRASPKPKVLTLCGDGASLRVKGAELQVFDQGELRRFEPSSKTPKAILFAGWGGPLTLQAVRFCADQKIAIILADWTGGLLSFVAPSASTSASLIRAQVQSSSSEA